ncbi:MAG: hypothetical protein ACXQT1_01380 [Methermicoccaceae archaeon]
MCSGTSQSEHSSGAVRCDGMRIAGSTWSTTVLLLALLVLALVGGAGSH